MHRHGRRLTGTLDSLVAALIEHLDGARAGEVVGVHQARVASRRLREALPLAAGAAGAVTVRRARRAMRGLTRALGPVREMDVALGLLDDLQAAYPLLSDPIDATRRLVTDERMARRVVMVAALAPEAAGAAIDAVAAVREGVISRDRPWRGVAARRVVARGRELGAAIDRAGILYNPDALHVVRIAAKKLRYALELAVELRMARAARAVRTLRRMQDLLGEMHDYQVLSRFAAEAAAQGTAILVKGEQQLVVLLLRKCLRIHAQYLRLRPGLTAVADQVAERFTALTAVRRPRHPGRRRRARRRPRATAAR
jgi:CHAD domain-containing protein